MVTFTYCTWDLYLALSYPGDLYLLLSYLLHVITRFVCTLDTFLVRSWIFSSTCFLFPKTTAGEWLPSQTKMTISLSGEWRVNYKLKEGRCSLQTNDWPPKEDNLLSTKDRIGVQHAHYLPRPQALEERSRAWSMPTVWAWAKHLGICKLPFSATHDTAESEGICQYCTRTVVALSPVSEELLSTKSRR